MTRTVIHIIIIIFILTSCDTNSNVNESKNEIEIGEYIFQFPSDFKLIKEKGIDSYVGKISNGKIDFQYDYGYYSNRLEKSVGEYLSEDVWKWNASPITYDPADTIDFNKEVAKMTLLKIQKVDSANYILKYRFSDNFYVDTILYPVKIPDYIINSEIMIDTVDNVMYKYVITNDYVGLYAKNLKSFNKTINSYKALSITARHLTENEKRIAFEILKSCKVKK